MSLVGRDISTGLFKTLKAATLIIIEDEIVLGLNFHCELNFVDMVWGWTKLLYVLLQRSQGRTAHEIGRKVAHCLR